MKDALAYLTNKKDMINSPWNKRLMYHHRWKIRNKSISSFIILWHLLEKVSPTFFVPSYQSIPIRAESSPSLFAVHLSILLSFSCFSSFKNILSIAVCLLIYPNCLVLISFIIISYQIQLSWHFFSAQGICPNLLSIHI